MTEEFKPIKWTVRTFFEELWKTGKKGVTWLVVAAIVGFVLWWLMPSTWKFKYAIQYMTDSDSVTVENKPYDCDWDTAPLGAKHCHYEAIDVAVNARGEIVDGSHVKLSPNREQISIDDGQTWHDAPANLTISKVHVGWDKVMD